MSARSKKCRDGRHDFCRETGLCRRSGCAAFHHAGQVTLFGRDLDPTAVAEARARAARTGQSDLFANPDRLEFAEIHSESRVGSDVKGGTANRFLQVIAQQFAGGRAFTARELAAEAGSSESSARQGVKLLRARGYVSEFGRELNAKGRPGPVRFVGTLTGEERAQSSRDMAAEAEGEALADREIAAREALAAFLGPRPKPGEGPVYRPVIRRQAKPGHKLPRLTAKRIRGAGYRVCQNPMPSGAVIREVVRAEALAREARRAKKPKTARKLRKAARKILERLVRSGSVRVLLLVKERLRGVARLATSHETTTRRRAS